MIFRFLALLLSYVIFACCSFESTFSDYRYSLIDRFNPIFGALWIESDFLLKVYLYGNEEKSPLVKCVKNIFEISDPHSISASDFKVKRELQKKMKLESLLDYLKNPLATIFEPLLHECANDGNDTDSIILWAAFYLSKERNISKDIFKKINDSLKIKSKNFQLSPDILKDVIYLTKHYRGTPPTQIQSSQSLPGAISASFFNCVESTTLDMLNFGMFSNPLLKENIKTRKFYPHWSKNKQFRKQLFTSIKQKQLIDSNDEVGVQNVYQSIFHDIYEGKNLKENWLKVNQDLPRISYVNFYIVESNSTCKGNANQELVKIDQQLYDSFEGTIEAISHSNEQCSQVKFKHLKDTNIYLTANDGIILYEIESIMRNFEGIIRYFFGVDFDDFKIDQSDGSSFKNLKILFVSLFNFKIETSLSSKVETTFDFTFKNNTCSGRFNIERQKHASTSDFICIPAPTFLANYGTLLNSDLSLKMKLSLKYFNLNGKTFDVDNTKVFSNKNFYHYFQSSLIKMERVFHYAEKSQHRFKTFFIDIAKKKGEEKEKALNLFNSEFIAKMEELSELNAAFQNVAGADELDFLKFLIKKYPNIDPAANDNLALWFAASYGNLDVVKYLVSIKETFPDIDVSANSFLSAAENGHLNVVKYFISIKDTFPKIDPAAFDNYAIHKAAENGHLAVVKYLASLKKEFPEINLKNPIYKAAAAENEHWDVVEYLNSIEKQLSIDKVVT